MSSFRALTMPSRPSSIPALRRSIRTPFTSAIRSFRHSVVQRDAIANPAPARRPIGAFRGGLFGFLFGSVLSGAGMYYYILEEYRVSNVLLTEDIFALQAAVQRIESYTKSLEGQVNELQKKRTTV